MGKYWTTKRSNFQNFLTSHKKTRICFEYLIALIATGISAFLTAFAFRAFLSPSNPDILNIVSGGCSGIARTIGLIAQMINPKIDMYSVYSISYFIINIPLLYVAFRFLGLRFGIFSALNVILVSIITTYMPSSFSSTIADYVACVIKVDGVNFQAGILARVIIAAMLNGVGSSIAFAANVSAGGADIMSYYFSARKSTNIGKYTLTINLSAMLLFSILYFTNGVVTSGGFSNELLAQAFIIFIFAIIYSIVLVLVIDFINRRNKKEQIQIITKDEKLAKLILTKIPHGATIVKAKGAFTGEERIIIYVVVSIYETKNVVTLIRNADPKSWVNVTSVKQVYGRFFIRPIK